MARSGRTAGGCNRPIEGKRFDSHATLSTAHVFVSGSITARCAKSGSPQRPSRAHSPECNRSAACCQLFRLTTERGQGRCSSSTCPVRIASFSDVISSAQQSRHVLEPRHERGRKPDARCEDEGEMSKHRHEGSPRRLIPPLWITESKAIQA